ncbi:MAG: SPASM domain-containing protein [Deltaproteobacteria bacterium]|nr:SPASM domain-containing protein [Deltaproteobacteria bacterium]
MSQVSLDEIFRSKAENIKTAWNHYQNRDTVLASLPFRGIIELTQNCNFRCVMCAQSWEPKYARYSNELNMPFDDFVRIGEQLFPSALSIDLRGFGESTILPYWPDVLTFLENYPLIEWNLVTNLALPRDEVWQKMCSLDFSIGFSCDGATKETFEAIRVRAHFNRILHNLGVVRDSIKSQGRGFIYFISTIQKCNMHEMRAIVELAREYNVDEVQFKAVQGEHTDQLLIEVDPELLASHSHAALDAAADLGIRVTFNDAAFLRGLDAEKYARVSKFRLKKDHLTAYVERNGLSGPLAAIADTARVSEHRSCFKSFSLIFVDHRLKVGTCNHMMHPILLEMGDAKTSSLSDIWNGQPYRDFRESHLQARPQDSRCQWCFAHRLDD